LQRFVPEFYDPSRLPENRAMVRLAYAIAQAARLHPAHGSGDCVLMIVQPGETNVADQRFLEYQLWEDHKIPVIRRTLAQIAERGALTQNFDLVIDERTVSVAYFRAGYTPRDYPSQKEWDALLLIERSRAIKCPNLGYHLAGSKKIQQALAAPRVLERFGLDADACRRLRRCFTGLWPLENDNAETKTLIENVLKDPSGYVLKPQREGGGNNLWGDDMCKVLREATAAQRSAFILMQKINTTPQKVACVRRGLLTVADCVSEMGVYSTFIGDAKRVHHNEASGHLLRTKVVGTNEGGVASGYAVLDSPLLT